MLIPLLVFGLLANLSAACFCDDMERGKLSFGSISSEDDFPKPIPMPRRSLEGEQQEKQLNPRLFKNVMAQRTPPNLLQVYTLLKGSDPVGRLVIDDYLQEPVVSRHSKKAEKGMLVDVMDFVTKTEDRNRRVGQNMRSSG
ncbi:unnamed protein product [Orchesella dallaii]|uniref:Uncharacterized protein n=1 Tax=Orchesella dallaii TaxID=48710 RepID=A0ABP1PXT2_9HEXA